MKWFSGQKACGELELAAKQAESENQAEPVPHHDPKNISQLVFKKFNQPHCLLMYMVFMVYMDILDST